MPEPEATTGKVAAVGLGFWVIKIIATTLGETGGDAVTMSMDLGYAVGTAIFLFLFVVSVAAQMAARKFHPFLFWMVIIATTTLLLPQHAEQRVAVPAKTS